MLQKYLLFIVFIVLVNISVNASHNSEILAKIAKAGFVLPLVITPLSLVPLIITYHEIYKAEKKTGRSQGIAIFLVIPFYAFTLPSLLLSSLSLSIAFVAKLGELGIKYNLFTPTQYGLGLTMLSLASYFYYRNKQPSEVSVQN